MAAAAREGASQRAITRRFGVERAVPIAEPDRLGVAATGAASHARERLGWGIEIALEVVPGEFSTRPAPATGAKDCSASTHPPGSSSTGCAGLTSSPSPTSSRVGTQPKLGSVVVPLPGARLPEFARRSQLGLSSSR